MRLPALSRVYLRLQLLVRALCNYWWQSATGRILKLDPKSVESQSTNESSITNGAQTWPISGQHFQEIFISKMLACKRPFVENHCINSWRI